MKKVLLLLLTSFCLSTAIAQPTAGLVAYFPMDGNFNDLGPYTITGTNFGATATTNYAGTANKAMAFLNPTSPVTQYAAHAINANVNFSGTQDFTYTFSLFANSPFVSNGGFYDNNLNYSGPGIWFWNSPGYPEIHFNYKNGSLGTLGAGALPLGVWNRIACVRASGVLKIYINGVLNNSGAEGSNVPAYAYTAKFGTMFYNGVTPPQYNGFNGALDEFRIYNRALTAAEIVTIATLPIKLTSFTATKNNADILLEWKTASEQNCDHFNVQRSEDGRNFTSIGSVKAIGNSSISNTYQFNDNTVKNITGAKHVFYRLESVDIDAKQQYSEIINMKLDAAKTGLTILQNPAVNELQLQFTSMQKQNISFHITDASGRMYLSKEVQINSGNIFTALPIAGLATGMYYITLVQADQKETLSFLKQ